MWSKYITFLVFWGIKVSHEFSYTNFLVKKFENCDQMNFSKLFIALRNKDNRQFVDADMAFPRSMDETVGMVMEIETTLDEKVYAKVFTIRDKNFCLGFHKYLGEFGYAIEKSAGLMRGACPIPKRRYRIRDHYLDYSKMSLQTFPFGKLRITTKAVDNVANNAILFCLASYVDNVIN